MTVATGWGHPDCAHLSALERRLAGWHMRVDPATVRGPISGLLVGEAPGPRTSKKLPLFPYPTNSAGGRLLKMSGLGAGQYLGRLLRRNLMEAYDLAWDAEVAGQHALNIINEQPAGRRVVLLGSRVGRAFGFADFYKVAEVNGAVYCCIPHPSGRNLLYNDVNHRIAARAAIQWAADCIVHLGGTAPAVQALAEAAPPTPPTDEETP